MYRFKESAEKKGEKERYQKPQATESQVLRPKASRIDITITYKL